MILEILTYPNKKLFVKSLEVKVFDEELHKFLDDMYETMIAKNGIGLAAIQTGEARRILIVNLFDEESKEQRKEDLLEIINPKILRKEGEIIYQEGCLSVPGYYEDVKRAEFITLETVSDSAESSRPRDFYRLRSSTRWITSTGTFLSSASATTNAKNSTKSIKSKKLYESPKMRHL